MEQEEKDNPPNLIDEFKFEDQDDADNISAQSKEIDELSIHEDQYGNLYGLLKHLYNHRNKIKGDLYKLNSEEKRIKGILEHNDKVSGTKRSREEVISESNYFDQENLSHDKRDMHPHKRSKVSENKEATPKQELKTNSLEEKLKRLSERKNQKQTVNEEASKQIKGEFQNFKSTKTNIVTVLK